MLHFFGSKAFLFAAAMQWPFDTDAAVEEVLGGPRSQLGARLASFFLSVWEDPQRREPIMVMLRAAATNAQAAELLRETLMTVFLGPLGSRLGAPDAGAADEPVQRAAHRAGHRALHRRPSSRWRRWSPSGSSSSSGPPFSAT